MAVLGDQHRVIKVVKPTDVKVPTEEPVTEEVKADEPVHQDA